MKEEKEVLRKIFLALKFLIYNDYENLEDDLKNDYGEIGTYLFNILVGFFEYLRQHKDLVDYISKTYKDILEKF